MKSLSTLLFVCCGLAAASPRVFADTAAVDARSFEYLDVIETADGSIWKGVIIEQAPNVQYKIAIAGGSVHVVKAADVVKISKERNADYRAAPASATTATPTTTGLSGSYERPGAGLPRALARSGARLDPQFTLVFPTGDIDPIKTSFAPTIRGGYEAVLGNFGLGGGGLTRFTYWQLPGMTKDAAWTLETMLYGRAALHVSRIAAYAGIALGVDTNYVYIDAAEMSDTTLGFGLNLESGVEVLASDALAFQLAFDYHPGTDTVIDGVDASISYFALSLGASVHL